MKQKFTPLILLLFSLAAWPLAWSPGPFPWLLVMIFIPILGWIDSNTLEKKWTNWIVFLYFILSGVLTIGWIFQVSWVGALIPILISAFLETAAILFLKWVWEISSRPLNRWMGTAAFVSLWILMEWLKDHLFTLAWLNLGMGPSRLYPFIQWYEFTGPYGGTALILILNILGYECLKPYFLGNSPKFKLGFPALWLGFLILPGVYSYFRYTSYEDFKSRKSYDNYHHLVNLVLVQSNINPNKKFIEGQNPGWNSLLLLSRKAAKSNTEYILWPETALGVQKGLNEDSLMTYPNVFQIRKFLVPYPNIALVTGAVTYRTASSRPMDTSWFNSAIQLENDDNISVYHKQILVPGVEKSPFSMGYPTRFPTANESLKKSEDSDPLGAYGSRDPLRNPGPIHPSSKSLFIDPSKKRPSTDNSVSPFMYLGGIHHYFTADGNPKILYSQTGLGIGPLICFESAFSDFARKMALNGAGILVVLSNDAWWGNSPAAYQHQDYARILAIENRRALAQSSNGGLSFIFNQKGDLDKEIPIGVSGAVNGDLEINENISFYTLYGDWILFPIGLIFIISLGYLLLKRKSSNHIFQQ